MIPWMFDTQAFAEKAATIAKEKADALAKQELEELQVGLGEIGMMKGVNCRFLFSQKTPRHLRNI